MLDPLKRSRWHQKVFARTWRCCGDC